MREERGCRKLGLQSAMEYLMTYGWAILIISVVLGALFQLGVFSGSSLAPKAQPGACKIIRPNGPGTTTFISLAGVCTGQLPTFIDSFDGSSSTVTVPIQLSSANSFTESVWVYGTATSGLPEILSTYVGGGSWGELFGEVAYLNKLSVYIHGCGGYCAVTTTNTMSVNAWHYVVGEYDSAGSTLSIYMDGIPQGTNTVSSPSSTIANDIFIGNNLGGNSYWKGLISNVQFYNTSLSAAEVQGLYAEGIGGAPMRLQSLVGWWPLNGDTNDYGGNGNNGVPTNVMFTSQYGK